jgi:hypothetical protein
VFTSEILQAWGKVLKGEPPSLSIEITKECPLKCPGCYAHDSAHLRAPMLRDLNDRRGRARSFEFSVRESSDTRHCPLAREPRNCLDRDDRRNPHRVPDAITDLRATLRSGVLPGIVGTGGAIRAQSWRNRWKLASTLAGVARRIVKFRKSQKICSQGDPAEGVQYVQQGGVKLSVINEDGKEAVLAILGPGDFFGEGCLAGQTVCMGTATAIAPTSVLFIEKKRDAARAPYGTCAL